MDDHTTATSTARCVRCSGTERVIAGDGPPICLICVLGWGSYAALAAGSSEPERAGTPAPVVGRDPTVTALLHWSHRVPVAGCPLCGAAAA